MCAPSFEFNLSLPFLDPPPALNSLQSPRDESDKVSGHFADDFLLSQAQTHQTTDQNDDEGSENALEGDAVRAADSIDHKTDRFWNRENVAIKCDVDLREGIVLDWDLLAKEFIVEAEKHGQFEHSLLHTHDSLAFLCLSKLCISDYDLNILHPFGIMIRNNSTALTFHEMLYSFCKAGMVNHTNT